MPQAGIAAGLVPEKYRDVAQTIEIYLLLDIVAQMTMTRVPTDDLLAVTLAYWLYSHQFGEGRKGWTGFDLRDHLPDAFRNA